MSELADYVEYQWARYTQAAVEPRVGYTLEFIGKVQHESAWQDIVGKAKRLIASGQVTILRNAPHHVMAHVVGDHGEYNCEISRHDPNSQIIEQWACECPWDQYAFDRTRKWKYLDGRVCSHVLAAYWKAKSTPIDITGQEPGFATPKSQKAGPAGPGQMQLPHMPTTPLEGMGEESPGAPSKQDITIPQVTPNPFSLPAQPAKPQIQQLQLFDITAPPGMQPVPPVQPVSVPGGRPPTPQNPVQFPGTFSHFIPVISLTASTFQYANGSEFEQWLQAELDAGRKPVIALTRPVTLEQIGGKIPMPGAQPMGTSPEGVPLYRIMELGYDPATGQRMNSGTGIQGAPEQRGVYSDAAAGRRGEVLDWLPEMKSLLVNIPLNYGTGMDARLHPHSLRGWVEYNDVRALPGSTTPFRRNR